jgi:hypothetical protein
MNKQNNNKTKQKNKKTKRNKITRKINNRQTKKVEENKNQIK